MNPAMTAKMTRKHSSHSLDVDTGLGDGLNATAGSGPEAVIYPRLLRFP